MKKLSASFLRTKAEKKAWQKAEKKAWQKAASRKLSGWTNLFLNC